MNTPQGTSMDYTNFKPTYSYKYLALYELDLDTEEYWMPKLLQTRLKVGKLYSAMQSTMAPEHLLKKVSGVEWNIGMWKLEVNPRLESYQAYQASNLVNSGSLPRTGGIRFLNGIPHFIWDNEGFLVVFPSQETIGWLNMAADLWCLQEESEGV